MSTVHDAFVESAGTYPDNPFLCVPPLAGRHYHPQGLELTYREVRARVDELMALYRDAGYGVGHRVALLLENRPEHLIHFLALNGLGVGIVPVNPDYRDDEMRYLLDHSEVEMVVSAGGRTDDLGRVVAGLERPVSVVNGERLPAALPGPRTAAAAGGPGLSAEATLFYTSGTTGRPKGCIISNDYHLTAGRWYTELGGHLAMEPGHERLLNPLPLFHMNAGAVSFCAMLLTGGCLVIPDRFHPRTWWQEVVASAATIIHYLGVMPPLLLNQPETPEERRHRVKVGVGAGIEPALHDRFERRFGFPLVEVWGMTETGRILADCVEPRRTTTRAFGKPLGVLEARVVDAHDREVPRNTEGELLVRCAGDDPRRGFFSGYLKNPEATEEAWRGGWFHTGDVVTQGDDGMLYFVDRKKNIIRRSGENIAAAEVEAVLQAHERVAQVAVVAVPDALREEEVLACVVPMPSAARGKALARELFEWCHERLAYYKAPGWVLFLDALPTTGTQKVQKARIFAGGVDPRAQPGIIDLRERKRRR